MRDTPAPARSDLPCPHVISDTMPPTEQVDGRFYESKAAFRAVGRQLGLTEVGDQKLPPKQRGSASRSEARARQAAVKQAIQRVRGG